MGHAVFDDIYSVGHAALGFAARFLAWRTPYASAVLIIVYIIYEVLELEKKANKLGDFVEFLLGYVLADVILS